MNDYDVWFTDFDGYGNHKILSAMSEADVIMYMEDKGYSNIKVSLRGNS